MTNTISNQAHYTQYGLQQYTSNVHTVLVERKEIEQGSIVAQADSVMTNSYQEVSMTYTSSLVMQTGNEQDQYSLLRNLVTNMLKEQGIDFTVATGSQEIDISALSQEEAAELVADDGYFGIEQTSDRIVDFATSVAGGDPARLAAIKEGVESGFNDALKAFGGTLPEISYNTYDAIMEKLDAWAKIESPEESS